MSIFRKEFDDEIERAIGDDERINFLKTMFSREVILSANVSFKIKFQKFTVLEKGGAF